MDIQNPGKSRGTDSGVFMAFLDDRVKEWTIRRTWLILVVVEGQVGKAGFEQILKGLGVKAGRAFTFIL